MNSRRDVVLLITHSGDYFTVDRVFAALSKRSCRPFRLDTDRFPAAIKIRAHFGDNGCENWLEYGDISLRAEEVRSVWLRRIWQPKFGEELTPEFQVACARESLATWDGFWDGLRSARWVDDVERIRAAENKLRQLRVAREVGLRIPQTLVTNDPAEVRTFFYRVGGKMVAKLLKPLSYSMKGSPFFLYTSAVKEEDLADLETLRHCPMVFQEEIPKRRELRAVFVDGRIFVGALDASKYAESTVDWRCGTPENCVWENHQLPPAIAEILDHFMAKFCLTFGAFDFIETPSGELVFLEVNPSGEWGMLERDLKLPISDAIADALLADDPS